MIPETKTCQNCQKNFIIEPEDFVFYDKMKVPAPTWCPECRLQRRLAWMIGIILWKRKCDLCGIETLSMYEPQASYRIYCHKCWWSDNWDARDYGRDYDFSRSFFDQWNELLHQVPLLGLSIDPITGESSPYTNHCGHAKNCYMIFYSDHNEECLCGYYLTRNKDCLNCSMIGSSELCFDGKNNFKNHHVYGSHDTEQSFDSVFLKDCINCQKCFGSAGLHNKSHVFFNEQLSREDYEKKINQIDLGSYETYSRFQKLAEENWKKFPPKPQFNKFSDNCTGSYVFESKNCQECYEVTRTQDSKFMTLIKTGPVKDSYDYTDWGDNASWLYECVVVGENVANAKFCQESGLTLNEIEYSKLQTNSSNCLGCVAIRKGQYYILNKQYSEEEYFKLRAKIIEAMNTKPYTDQKGRVYQYGEFFPMEFSPYAYNNTFANLFFPKTESEIKDEKLKFYQPDSKEYLITLKSKDLPDQIKETPNEITKEVIGCSQCSRGYKIIKPELEMSQRMNVPLSRVCPFCRIGNKVSQWVTQMKQVIRFCDQCGKEFKTHYNLEEAPKISCQECYQQETI